MTPEQIEFNTKWIAALRSGEYQQGRMYLLYDGKYCCHGVAAVVAELPMLNRDKVFSVDYGKFGSAQSVPPRSWFKEKTGFSIEFMDILWKSNDGLLVGEGEIQPKKTFTEIADMIEAEMESMKS